MRSSKSRSRSKGNRNRSVGNIVNRVFDSSGPEGKVRGTPQQIIDKYNQLARDAQLSNDRVAAENFQQHAEHYLRMLSEAQREMQERQQQGNQGQGGYPNNGASDQQQSDQGSGDRQPEVSDDRNDGGYGANEQRGRSSGGRNRESVASATSEEHQKSRDSRQDIIDLDESSDGGLVETPEDKPKRKRRARSKPEEAEQIPAQPTPDAAE
jgi:type II secretory pathway pseudopilin PulG